MLTQTKWKTSFTGQYICSLDSKFHIKLIEENLASGIFNEYLKFQLDGPNAGSYVHEDEEDEPDFYVHGMGG